MDLGQVLIWTGIPAALLLLAGQKKTLAEPTVAPAVWGNVNNLPVIRPAGQPAPPSLPTGSGTPVTTPVPITRPDGSVVPAGSPVINIPPGSTISAADAIAAGYMNTVLQPGVDPEDIVLYLQPEGGTVVPAQQVPAVVAAAQAKPAPTGFATSTPTGYTTPLPEGWVWPAGSGVPINITIAPPDQVEAALIGAPPPSLPSTRLVFIDGVPTILPAVGAMASRPNRQLVSQGWLGVWVV